MAIPILRLNIDDNPQIFVKPDINPVQVTGNSYYVFTGVSPTIVTDVQTGNLHTISIQAPSGATGASGATGNDGASGITPTLIFTGSGIVNYTKSGTTYTINVSGATGAKGDKGDAGTTVWSGLTGLPTDNSDLVDLLSGYSLTSHTHTQYALVTTVTGLTSSFTSHTGDTSIHFKMGDITGFTSTQAFTNHTGDTDIHYVMSGISIAESQVQGLVGKYSLSGHTHPQYLTEVSTSQITGVTDSLYVGINTYIYDMNVLSGVLDGKSDTGHTHPQYLTEVSTSQITGVTDSLYVNISSYNYDMNVLSGILDEKSDTGHTHNYNSTFVNVTGDTMTGALVINDNGTTGTTANWLRINSANKHWLDGGEEVGRIDFWVTDTSGAGEHTGAQIAILNALAGQTTPRCDMVFKTGFNEEATERMRIDYLGNVKIQTLTASRAIVTDANQNLTEATTTATEIGYVNGVTSSIQTQLNGKSSTGHTHPQYLTGYTVTAADVTGITATLYSPTAHTHTGVYVPFDTSIVSVTGATTLNSTHQNKIIEASGTFTITLPNSMPTGYRVDIVNVGTGTITLAASTTLQSDGTKLETQYTGASVYHRGSNVWIAVGKLTT